MTILKDELNNELVVALENVKNSWSDISCMNGTCEVTTSCINEGSSPEVNAELTISGLRYLKCGSCRKYHLIHFKYSLVVVENS